MSADPHPLVSIIIPCYNYGKYLNETLQQVLSQQYSAWECIIVNDGSADHTESIAREFAARDGRFSYIFQTNKGLSTARNTGITNSKGDYIQLLDADDALHHRKLELQTDYLERHPEADLVYGDALYFHTDRPGVYLPAKDGYAVKHQGLKRTACSAALLGLLCINNILEVSCPLIRRSLVEKTGLFDTAYTSFEDWQYWIRSAALGACFHYWPEPGTETFIRFGHASMMTHQKRMNENGTRLRQFMMPLLPVPWKWYNRFRLLKLSAKKIWLSLQG